MKSKRFMGDRRPTASTGGASCFLSAERVEALCLVSVDIFIYMLLHLYEPQL